jgi:hypothetical protein
MLKIRKELTDTLRKIDEKSEAAESLQAMRAACRQYIDKSELRRKLFSYRGKIENLGIEAAHELYEGLRFDVALGELRTIFRIHIAKLCSMYRIDLEGKLLSILPPAK